MRRGRQMRGKTCEDSFCGISWGNEWRQSGPRSPLMPPLRHSLCSCTRWIAWQRTSLVVRSEVTCVRWQGLVLWCGHWREIQSVSITTWLSGEALSCQTTWKLGCRGSEREIITAREAEQSSYTVSRKCCWGFSIFLAFQLVGWGKNHVRYSGTACNMNFVCVISLSLGLQGSDSLHTEAQSRLFVNWTQTVYAAVHNVSLIDWLCAS